MVDGTPTFHLNCRKRDYLEEMKLERFLDFLGQSRASGHQPETGPIEGPFKNLGKGLCRGEDWNLDESWPQDGEFQTVENCGIKCESTPGCNAFDVSNYNARNKKYQCWLHKNKNPEPASGLDGTCYKLSQGSDESLGGPGLIKIGKCAKI